MAKQSRDPRRKKAAKPGRVVHKGDMRDRGLENPRHWLDVSPDKPEHPLGFDYLEGPTEASKPLPPAKVERPD